jgi:DNA-binding GntR family transcriptional regulator
MTGPRAASTVTLDRVKVAVKLFAALREQRGAREVEVELADGALVEGYEVRLALELHAADMAVETAEDERIAELRDLLAETAASISHEDWDTANATFHETQVDLAGNELLSRFYRELSVNLMMQVIRGGRVERGEYLVTEHRAIVEALEARDRAAARDAIVRHVDTGRRIALDAIERSGGSL